MPPERGANQTAAAEVPPSEFIVAAKPSTLSEDLCGTGIGSTPAAEGSGLQKTTQAPVVDTSAASETVTTGAETANTENAAAPPENDKDTETMAWESPARMFCPVNGRSHGVLLDFKRTLCPLCQDKLVEPTNPKASPIDADDQSSEDGQPEDGVDDKGAETKPDEEKPTKDVAYVVEYLDRKQHFISKQPLDAEFDLSVARQGVESNKDLAFEIVTVVHTAADKTQIMFKAGPLPPSRQNILHELIMKDPSISIRVHSTRLVIHSTFLLRTLRKFVRFYPSINLDAPVVWLGEPFALIAHHLQELKSYFAEISGDKFSGNSAPGSVQDEEISPTPDTRHLGALLDYFSKSTLPAMLEEQERHTRKMCTFRMLWLLYKPGDTVYLESHDALSAYVVNSVVTDPAIMRTIAPDIPAAYLVQVWNLTYDGRYVGRTLKTVMIAPFEGERKIISMRLIPAAFFDAENHGETRQKLEEQGRFWYELLPGRQVYYSGPVLKDADPTRTGFYSLNRVRETLRGRVYIDPASYSSRAKTRKSRVESESETSDSEEESEPTPRLVGNFHGRNDKEGLVVCQCEECRGLRPHPPDRFLWRNYDVLDPTVDKDLTLPGAVEGPNHRYLLCDRVLAGFDLKSRSWVQLDVAYCRPLKTNVRAIDNLVMPSERKDMIKALIQRFTSVEAIKGQQRTWAADFIENKGEGQIFLLHGSPGVGKTYASFALISRHTHRSLTILECIAEYTGRPLLSLTCGDIGTDELKMEQQLSKWFKLAEKWGAVMLIDEADVYLEQRLVTDLKRNSLVSVFLRCIEYYRGVLFLTTNRVGHFDDAFITRIHVIIRYDDLDRESRKTIWTQFFDKLHDEREDFKTTQRAKDYVLEDGEISHMNLNGREIRNAFQTAVALAEYRFTEKQGSSKQKQPTLDEKDFEQVCKMMQQFKKYMFDLHGADQEDRAYLARSRASRLSENAGD